MTKQYNPQESGELFRTITNSLAKMLDGGLDDMKNDDLQKAEVISNGIIQGKIRVFEKIELSVMAKQNIDFTIIGPDEKEYTLFNYFEQANMN